MAKRFFQDPNHLLVILTLVNLLNYIDRYLLAALLPRIQADLSLSHFQAGLLGTAFMLGYMLASPFFGFLGDRYARKIVICAGVAAWSLATWGSGLAPTFFALLAMRVGVGLGEASYATLAPPWIDDTSTPDNRNRRLSIFYVAIPAGAALGYVAGGFLQDLVGWRGAFSFAAVPGLFLAVYILFFQEARPTAKEKPLGLRQSFQKLSDNGEYRGLVGGYILYTFALGGFSFWAPKYLEAVLGMPLQKANLNFGLLTLTTGILGTLAGGRAGTTFFRRLGNRGYALFCGLATLLAVPLACVALGFRSAPVFFGFSFLAELFLFASTGPINSAILGCVPTHLRASAMALSIFSIHALGDLLSPSLMGRIADLAGLRVAMGLFPLAILAAAIVWSLAGRKRRN